MPVVLFSILAHEAYPKDGLLRGGVLEKESNEEVLPRRVGPDGLRLQQRPPHSNASAAVWNHTGTRAVQPVWTAAEHTPPTRVGAQHPTPNPPPTLTRTLH